MKKIPLTQNKFALVDDDDFKYLNRHKWYALNTKYTSYVGMRIKGKPIRMLRMHRIILNPKKEEEIDHINGNGLDNRRSNLRIVTPIQNKRNRFKRGVSSSKYKGVNWYKRDKKWCVRIKVNCKYIFLGYFKSEIEAAMAYNKASLEYHGEYGRRNVLSQKTVLSPFPSPEALFVFNGFKNDNT